MDIKFKTCPFCGGEAGADVLDPFICDGSFPNRYTGVVYCDKCGVHMLEVGETPKKALDRAIEAWNTRAERTCRMEHNERKRGVYCSHCGKRMDSFVCNNYGDGTMEYAYPFCCKCSAKVVE